MCPPGHKRPKVYIPALFRVFQGQKWRPSGEISAPTGAEGAKGLPKSGNPEKRGKLLREQKANPGSECRGHVEPGVKWAYR